MSRKPSKLPPIELVEAVYEYDPVNGLLIRKKTGVPVQCNDRTTGQIKVRCGRVVTSIQRVCWLLYHRSDPGGKRVTHKDGNPFNNRIENLQLKR